MSCGARLPIYLLLVGAFFPKHASIVLFGLYTLGIIVAIITAKLMRRFKYKEDETPFVMELPPYRVPTLQATMRHMWAKGQQYLKKMGGVILVASLIIWALSYFPRPTEADLEKTKIEFASQNLSDEQIEVVTQTENSYLGQIGKFVSPIFEPLGYNWKMTVSLISGTVAKETVVSTLGVLYSGDAESEDADLGARLQTENPQTGEPDFNVIVALSFLVFVLLYVPCIATITAIVKETGSWKFGAFTLIYNTAVAWFVAFIFYQVGSLFM